MATNFKGPTKARVTQKTPPISLKDELDAEDPVEAPVDTPYAAPAAVEVESVASESIASEPVAITVEADIVEPEIIVEPAAQPVVVAVTASVAPPAPPVSSAAPAALDPSALPLKTLDLFNENAAAMLDFALALGTAKSVGDALELQSRFASERYSSLVRQAGEFADLTRRLAFQSSPVKLSFSGFIA
jgi:cell division septation protein DedD